MRVQEGSCMQTYWKSTSHSLQGEVPTSVATASFVHFEARREIVGSQ